MFAQLICIVGLSGPPHVEEGARAASQPAANEAEDESAGEQHDGHDFLFLVEPAYLQRENEFQATFQFGYLRGRAREREFEFDGDDREIEVEHSRYRSFDYTLELEYGVTDRLQISAEVPYAYAREYVDRGPLNEVAEFGDAELSLAYAWTEETDTVPTVTTFLSLALPTGHYETETGYERVGYGGLLAVSKMCGPFTGHANLGYEYVPNARLRWENGEDGPPTDLHSFSYGVAGTYDLNEQWQFILEVAGETGHELELDRRRWETELLLVPGVRYDIETEHCGAFMIGVGLPIGLTSDSPDWGVFAKLQWELEF